MNPLKWFRHNNNKKYLLDSCICIEIIKGNRNVIKHCLNTGNDICAISIISYAELLYGAYHSGQLSKECEKINKLMPLYDLISIDDSIEEYAQIKQSLKSQGKMIDEFDILIAATALHYDLILVTNNEKHFERIDNLIIENWVKE